MRLRIKRSSDRVFREDAAVAKRVACAFTGHDWEIRTATVKNIHFICRKCGLRTARDSEYEREAARQWLRKNGIPVA